MADTRRSRLMAGVAAILIAAGLAVAVTPGSAAAATSCYWYSGQIGNTSNCDGLYKHQTTCAASSYVVYSRQLRRVGNGPYVNIYVQLWYSDVCDTMWAMIPANGYPASSGNTGCKTWIVRNSDGQRYREPVDPGIDFAYTKMLYDQTQGGVTVTGYAEAECDNGIYVYRAVTPSW